MTRNFHGWPCWFELGTSDIDAARAFYPTVLGWQIGDSAMPDFDYRLAQAEGDMVAGLMSLDQQSPGTPPNWLVYICADNVDETARQAREKGGKVLKEPADIPGTGRFAVLADPQGAVFGILQPDMASMSETDRTKVEAGHGAFDQSRRGHGNWIELMSSDPKAGLDFYAGLFGWTRGEAMPMGEMGDYQLFRHGGTDIGAVQGLGRAPMPAWLPYFGVPSAAGAVEAIGAAGGTVHHGPQEVPGGVFIVIAADPQGAFFAVVGPG